MIAPRVRRDRAMAAGAALIVIVNNARATSAPAMFEGASAASAAAPAPERDVEVTVVGTEEDLARLRGVVESHRSVAPVLRWTRVGQFNAPEILRPEILRDEPTRQQAALRCWVNMLDRRRARLYFVARSGRQFLMREVELSGRFDELDREALSQVIELSMTALLENERAGLTRAEAQKLLTDREPPSTEPPETVPPLAPARAPPARIDAVVRDPRRGPTNRPRSLAVGAFYHGRGVGRAAPLVHGGGVSLTWRTPAGQRIALGVWANAQYQLPADIVTPDIGMRFETFSMRGGLLLGVAFDAADASGPGMQPSAAITRLGLGPDLLRLTPQPGSVDAMATLTPARWSQSLVVTGAVGVEWNVARHLALGVAATLEVVPTEVRYDMDVAGTTTPVFAPWRFRPGVELAASIR